MMKNLQTPIEDRSGVTLTEVLMSLMIMAIGVTSVVTLFPIATLRSAQASKLTNAAVLKYNLETLLEIHPHLIFDPDGDGDLNEHFAGRAIERNYIVDPSGYFNILEYSSDLGQLTDPDNALTAGFFGRDQVSLRVSGIPRFDGGVRQSLFPSVAPGALTDTQRRAARLTAESLSSLGDNWETIYDFVPESLVNGSGASIPNDGSVGGGAIVSGVVIPTDVVGDAASAALIPTSINTIPIGMRDAERTRITVFSSDGEFSTSYPLLQVGTALGAIWSESLAGRDFDLDGDFAVRGLPREFRLAASGNWLVGRVIIQKQKDVDYSWLLTVRRSADGRVRSMDAVVRFGSGLKLEHESLHVTTNTEDLNGNGSLDSGEDLDGDGLLDAPFAPDVFYLNSALTPGIKRGGYIFDAGNVRWHRIRDYDEGTWMRVVLEKPATPAFVGPAIVLPGIVDVFPMGSRSIPDVVQRGF